METHGTIAWRTPDDRIHVRTSTQTPHLVKIKLAYLFQMYPHQFHVFSECVGGGFGGKQELLTEDLCVLAALKTGRPVKWEFTRSEQFTAATSRHPMKITIKLGAKKDGTLTAMQIHTVSNTGAYGNHGGEVLASSLGSSMATYRCPNKKGTGYAVYTNTVPSGAFRGYGATQPAFAIESAIDELGRKLGIDPFTMRRKNMIRAARSRAQHLALPARRRDRQLRAGPVPRFRRTGPGERQGRAQARRRRMAGRQRCRHPCAGLCARPRNIARKPTCRCCPTAPTT